MELAANAAKMQATGVHDKTLADLDTAKLTTTEKTDAVVNTATEDVDASNAINQDVIDTAAAKNLANTRYANAQTDSSKKTQA